MTRNSILGSLLAVAFTSAVTYPVRAAETYTLDPVHTSIIFSVSHTGLSYTYGCFRKVAGSYVLDEANPANCRFQLVIQTNSLDTNHGKRDEHLRGPDFFDAQQFPTITFQSTGCALANTNDQGVVYQVKGNLTMHGETRQVSFPLRMLGEGKGPYGDSRTGFLCQLELKRSDYGMKNLIQNNLVGDAVGITISFEGVLQEQPQPEATTRAR